MSLVQNPEEEMITAFERDNSYIRVYYSDSNGFRTEYNDNKFLGEILFDLYGEIEELRNPENEV